MPPRFEHLNDGLGTGQRTQIIRFRTFGDIALSSDVCGVWVDRMGSVDLVYQ